MEITKTNQTTNVNATTNNSGLTYSLNYSIQESKITNLNGQISKETNIDGTVNSINIGSFYINGQLESKISNCNFYNNATLDDKKQIIEDIEVIYSNLSV